VILDGWRLFHTERGCSCHCARDGSSQYDDICKGVNSQDDVQGYCKDVCGCSYLSMYVWTPWVIRCPSIMPYMCILAPIQSLKHKGDLSAFMHHSTVEFDSSFCFRSIRLCSASFNVSGIDGNDPHCWVGLIVSLDVVVTTLIIPATSFTILFMNIFQLSISCPCGGLLLCSVSISGLLPVYTDRYAKCHMQSIHLSAGYSGSSPWSVSLLVKGLMMCSSTSSLFLFDHQHM
jgi:hypothetical protein